LLAHAISLAPAAASGDLPTAVLEVDTVPPDCPEAHALEAAVEARLGRDAIVPAPPSTFRIRVTIPAGAPPLVAHVVLEETAAGVIGERTLRIETTDCAALVTPLALVVALLVETPRREAEIRLPPPAPPSGRAPPRAAPVAPWRSVPELQLGVLAGVHGPLAGGAALAVAIEAPGALSVRVRTEVVTTDLGVSATHASVRAARVELAGCALLHRGLRASSQVCFGVAAALVRAEGLALDQAAQSELPAADIGAAAWLALLLTGPFWLTGELGAVVPAVRTRFVYRMGETERVAWKSWAIAPIVRIGVALRLPGGEPP
jgi:hypothetical protein